MALVLTTGMSQFTHGTYTTKFFFPVGWNAADPNSHFHVHFLGNGENTVDKIENLAPGSLVKNGGTWDGLIYQANGNIARIAILFIHSSTSFGVTQHASVIDHCIETLAIPTTGIQPERRFQASGISGGPGRFYNYAMNSTSPYKHLFRKRLIMSPVNIHGAYPAVANEDARGFTWIYYASDDKVVSPSNAWNLFIVTKGKKKIEQAISTAHSASLWNPKFSTAGLNTPNGSTAEFNVWRYLADPYDGLAKHYVAGKLEVYINS